MSPTLLRACAARRCAWPVWCLAVVAPALRACDMIPDQPGSTSRAPSSAPTSASPATESTASASVAGPPAAPLANYQVLAQEAAMPVAVRVQVRAMPAAQMHAPGTSPLIQGLSELAAAQPATYAYAVNLLPSRDWYRSHGGVGHYSVGSATHPEQMISGMDTRVEQEQLGDSTKALMLDFDARDIPDGTHAEMAYTQYTATMDVDVSRVALKGVYTQVLVAPRIIVTGNASFFAGYVHYPLELPNVAVDNIATTVRIPAGAVPDDDDDDAPRLSVRDPRMVFAAYQAEVAALTQRHPAVAMVFATVPLTAGGNYQRNFFNESLRAWCAAHHRPLLDVADLLATDLNGNPVSDAQGPRLAPELMDPQTHAPNALARARLARGWWWMMARLGGWTPPT